MGRRLKLSFVALVTLFACPGLIAGKGGGHGGGGHGGGHSGAGGSSGHSFGHPVGHSLGHLFGHRSGGRSSEKNVGTHTDLRVGLVPARFHRRGLGRGMHFRNRLFNSGYCDSFRFSWRNSFFPREFDCFDPFLYAGSFGTYFWSDSWMPPGDSGALSDSPDSADNATSAPQEEPRSFASSLANVEEPIALLQLLDGSMYGLSRYWVEGTNLHYVTDYGGENKIPLERIDFARTAELNAERGLQFDLTKKSTHP